MNKRICIKIIVDICMTICLLFLMPYSLIGETAHEWIGMAMGVLFIAHHILNRKWLSAVRKGRYTPYRVTQTVLAVIMFVLMLGSMVSGILLSNHLFRFIRIAGVSMAARQVHMFCAFWGFVVMSLHIGIHWGMVVSMTGRLFKKPSVSRKWLVKAAGVLIPCYGVYAFYKRQIGDYLLMRMHFVFYDYSEKVIFFILDYMAAMSLIVFIGYYFSKYLKYITKKQH